MSICQGPEQTSQQVTDPHLSKRVPGNTTNLSPADVFLFNDSKETEKL